MLKLVSVRLQLSFPIGPRQVFGKDHYVHFQKIYMTGFMFLHVHAIHVADKIEKSIEIFRHSEFLDASNL